MRNLFLLLGLMFLVPATAQQITNVTTTPSPLHACVPIHFNVSGTSSHGQLGVSFVESEFGDDFISMTLDIGNGPGTVPYTYSMGPFIALGEGSYDMTFRLRLNGQITSTWTGTLDVLAPQLPNVGDPTTITVCSSDAPFSLLSRMEGNPEPGGLWIDPSLNTVPGGMFIPGTSIDGQYMYFFELEAPCDIEFQLMTITTLQNSSAGEDATVSICTQAGGDPVELFPLLGGNPDAGGTWSGPGGSSGVFTPGVSPIGEYVYQVAGIAPCSDPTATVTVQPAPENNAGTGSPALFCFDETNAHLAPYVTGGENSGYWLEPTGFAIAYYNDPIDVSVYGAGVYKYVVDESSCPADTAFVTVTLDGPPCTLGMDAISAEGNFLHLVPNPATGYVTVEGRLAHAGKDLALTVSDMQGRVVLHQALPKMSRIHRTVDLSTLAPGTYLVQVVGGPEVPVQRLVVH